MKGISSAGVVSSITSRERCFSLYKYNSGNPRYKDVQEARVPAFYYAQERRVEMRPPRVFERGPFGLSLYRRGYFSMLINSLYDI